MRYSVILVIVILSSCISIGRREKGNGDMITETYSVSKFTKVNIGGAYKVVLAWSEEPHVEVEIDENLVEFLEVDTYGNTLEIRNTERISSKEGIEVIIYYTELETLNISGACELRAENTIKSDRLALEMSGAGAIELSLDVTELDLDISGAGAVSLEGDAKYQRIRMSGAGGYSGFDLYSENADIEISGVGSADIRVSGDLKASIGGLGGINYKGHPKTVDSSVSGLGSVSEAD